MTTPWKKAILIPAGAALIGSLAGGLLGFAAGKLGPDAWRYAMSTPAFWSVGVPTLLGAAAGGAMAGGLACLGLCIQAGVQWMRRNAC